MSKGKETFKVYAVIHQFYCRSMKLCWNFLCESEALQFDTDFLKEYKIRTFEYPWNGFYGLMGL